eukprot:gene2596-2635_t
MPNVARGLMAVFGLGGYRALEADALELAKDWLARVGLIERADEPAGPRATPCGPGVAAPALGHAAKSAETGHRHGGLEGGFYTRVIGKGARHPIGLVQRHGSGVGFGHRRFPAETPSISRFRCNSYLDKHALWRGLAIVTRAPGCAVESRKPPLLDDMSATVSAHRIVVSPSCGVAVLSRDGETWLLISGRIHVPADIADAFQRLAVGIIDAAHGPAAGFEFRAGLGHSEHLSAGWNWFHAQVPCRGPLPESLLIDLVAEGQCWMFQRGQDGGVRVKIPGQLGAIGHAGRVPYFGWMVRDEEDGSSHRLGENLWPRFSTDDAARSLKTGIEAAYALAASMDLFPNGAAALAEPLGRLFDGIDRRCRAGARLDSSCLDIASYLSDRAGGRWHYRSVLAALDGATEPAAAWLEASLERRRERELALARGEVSDLRALLDEVIAPWLDRSVPGSGDYARLKELEWACLQSLEPAPGAGAVLSVLSAPQKASHLACDESGNVAADLALLPSRAEEARSGALTTAVYLSHTAPALLRRLADTADAKRFEQSIAHMRRVTPIYLVVTRVGYPMGGGEAYMHQTCRLMRELGFRTIWVNFVSGENRPHAFDHEVETPFYLDVRLAAEMTEASIAEAIGRFAPDVMHSQGVANGPVAAVAQRLRVPTLMGYHFWDGLVSLGFSGNVGIKANFALHSATRDFAPCRWIRRYLASEFMLDVYRSLGGVAALEVFHPVPEPAHYRTARDADADFVVQININALKGGAILLDCIRALGDTIPFLVVRTEPNSERLDDDIATAIGAAPRSRYETYGDARNWYRKARLVMVPTLVDETFCRVAFEAAMNGIPVLCTRCGFLPSMFGESGVYLSADADDWVVMLRELYADPERLAEIGARQRAHVTAAFGHRQDGFLDAVRSLTAMSQRRNVGIMTAWADQGLGNQSRLYAKLYREAGLRCHVLSYQPYAASGQSLTLQAAPDDWAAPLACDSVYYSYNHREALTQEEIAQFCAVNNVGILVVPEICWSANWDKLLGISIPNLSICAVPNIEIVRRAEAGLHDRLARTFYNTRVAETVLYGLGVRNGARIGHGFGSPASPGAVEAKVARLTERRAIRYLHVAGHNPRSRKQTEAVVSAFARALAHRSDIELVITCMVDLPEIRRRLGTAVDFRVGTFGHADILTLYAESDVSVQVSSHEGLGLGFYESLSTITPVITLDVPPHNEAVKAGVSGWFVRSHAVTLSDNDDAVVQGAVVDEDDLMRVFAGLDKAAISQMFRTTAGLHADCFTETGLLERLVATMSPEDLRDHLVTCAFGLLDHGLKGEAANVLEAAGALGTVTARMAFLRAYLAETQGAPDGAPAWSIDALVETGKRLRARHLRQASEVAFRVACERYPVLPWAHVHLGVELRDRGALDDAMAWFQSALALEPDHVGALTEAAATCRMMQDDEGEERYLRDGVRHHPKANDLRYALASLLRQKSRFAEARTVLDAAEDQHLRTFVDIERALLDWQAERDAEGLAALCGGDARAIESVGTFMNSAVLHRRIARDILVDDSSDWLTSAGEYDTLLQSAERAAEMIMQAVVDRAGFSFVRLGDGEGALLSYVDRLQGEQDPAHRLHGLMLGSEIWNTWLGRDIRDEDPAGLIGLADRLGTAVSRADLVGIPKVSDCAAAITYIEHHGCARSHEFVLRRRHEGLVVSQMNVMLHGIGLYERIVASQSSMSVITCHSGLGPAIERRFGGIGVRSYLIPLQFGHRELIGPPWSGARHFPDVFEAICRDIEVPAAGHVFFVAAGVFGKIYCDIVRSRGGIGLDIGAMADAFAGFDTRPSISAQKRVAAVGTPVSNLFGGIDVRSDVSGLEQAQEGLEHAHHAAHGEHGAGHTDRFPIAVGFMVGVLALALSLTESEVRSANDDYMTNHIAVSDTWAFFQAKNLRKASYVTSAAVLENLPDQNDKLRAQVAEFRAEAARMDDEPKTGEGRKQLAAKALEQTKLRDHAHEIGDKLERSVGFLQIAIVLASLSIVGKMKPLAFCAGLLGFGAAAYALAVHLHMA